jgi:hypothetical protein
MQVQRQKVPERSAVDEPCESSEEEGGSGAGVVEPQLTMHSKCETNSHRSLIFAPPSKDLSTSRCKGAANAAFA